MNQPGPHPDKGITPYRSSLRIALIYLFFAVIWIVFGDRLLLLVFRDSDVLTTYQTYKELIFVGGSATLIFVLARNALNRAARLQQNLREKEEKYRLLIENQDDLVVKVDPQGRFLFVSPSYCTTFGKTETELLGQEFLPLVHEADRKAKAEAMEFFWDQPPSGYLEHRALTIQGWRWFGWSDRYILDKNNKLVAVIGVGRDITANKVQENELAREKLLQKSITEQALVHKTEEMEQFVDAVSHGFKSPLITIQTFLQLLEQDLENNDRELITGNINHISVAADKIDTLLEALELLSRIGSRNDQLTSICPNKVIDNTLAIHSGSLLQKNINVIMQEIPFQLTADLFHLEQLWQNLIENAIKYMGDQPDPQISLGVDLSGEEPLFYVCDNGIGIAAMDGKRVFSLFTQLDNNSAGIGFGLALVKKIIDTYQGKIWVESEGKGKGSCFKFTLPAAVKKAQFKHQIQL